MTDVTKSSPWLVWSFMALIVALTVASSAGCNLYVDLAGLDEAGVDGGLVDGGLVDGGGNDGTPSSNLPDEVCSEDSTRDFCARFGAQCGLVQGRDICGDLVAIVCGTCTGGLICHDDQRCACERESVSQFCARLGAQCGSIEGVDACGVQRNYACGRCADDAPCEDNQCCQGESEAELCEQVESCGTSGVVDSCGLPRAINCEGTCEDANRRCMLIDGGWCCATPGGNC